MGLTPLIYGWNPVNITFLGILAFLFIISWVSDWIKRIRR